MSGLELIGVYDVNVWALHQPSGLLGIQWALAPASKDHRGRMPGPVALAAVSNPDAF